MIEKVSIRNWQSIRKLDLDLGRFTVIVGPSSSGKSAFMRALKAVASNVRGTAPLTRGTTTAAITVRLDDGDVTLEHVSGAWRYRSAVLGHEETYTKLNGAVPSAITNILRINPVPSSGASLNFAGQFDPPYLLRESGATVARELGELTNVDTIYAAVREANRRRAAAASALKTRESDLADLKGQLARYAGLQDRRAAAERAEEALNRAAELESRAARLESALHSLEVAETVLARATLPTVPDLDAVTAAHHRFLRFVQLAQGWQAAQRDLVTWVEAVTTAQSTESGHARALHDTLVAAGHCPTCGQQVA